MVCGVNWWLVMRGNLIFFLVLVSDILGIIEPRYSYTHLSSNLCSKYKA